MDALRARIFALVGIPVASAGLFSGSCASGYKSAAGHPPLTPACGPDEERSSSCSFVGTDRGPRAPAPFEECSATEGEARFDARRTALQRDETSNDACCYSGSCRPMGAAAEGTMGGGCGGTSCMDPPEGGTRFPAPGAPHCPAAVNRSFVEPSAFVGLQKGKCCYSVSAPCRGRPLSGADGRAVVADRARSTAWLDDWTLPGLDDLPPAIRRAAAESWLADAALEHASIASFAWLALDLLALGAPSELVAAAHEAALDEVRHARRGFAIASALAGEPLGPGRLACPERKPARSRAELAVAALREGCVEETIAAVAARVGADASDPGPIADALRAIADDEDRHAELSWHILVWALGNADEDTACAVDHAARAVRAELEDAHCGRGPDAQPDLARLGILDATRHAAVRRDVLERIVLPSLDAAANRQRG